MDVFISSLIGGYEPLRDATDSAIRTLGHQVVRAEDFLASTRTPQQACLAAVRASDLVVLLVVDRYGDVQASGRSATHEEYLEARGNTPVLVFVQQNVEREDAQQRFLEEVQAWTTGHYRAAFSDPEKLRDQVIGALHAFELATTSSPLDEAEMVERATALLQPANRDRAEPALSFVVAPGPHRQVIGPAELEDPVLARDIQREAMFGDHAVLENGEGTRTSVEGNTLWLVQPRASISVDESGGLRITQPPGKRPRREGGMLPSIIEEDVAAALVGATRFAGWVLDRVDPLQRLTDVVPAAQLVGAGYMPWRTRVEQQASPNAATISMSDASGRAMLTPPRRHRPALIHDADSLVGDLVTLLRRGQRS
jgi:hypothetical protein